LVRETNYGGNCQNMASEEVSGGREADG
jgi:hypothetical protein